MSAAYTDLLATLETARELAAGGAAAPTATPDGAAAAGWLQRCIALCQSAPVPRPEPLRTLHHFACTGGTLISKCIAALPNVQLLSEVDPLSSYVPPGANGFTPSDMVALLRASTRGSSPELVAELFRAQMRVLHRETARQGLRMVVRDHAHSHFCQGSAVPERPSLRELMPAELPLLSLLTVRHPLDSFASLAANGWLHFEPRSIDTYCRRYLAFLDRHAGVPVLRYEDFVAAPQRRMEQLCERLELRYEPHFEHWFSGFRVSGDSGRGGDSIAARPTSERALAMLPEARASRAYLQLVQRLDYAVTPGLA